MKRKTTLIVGIFACAFGIIFGRLTTGTANTRYMDKPRVSFNLTPKFGSIGIVVTPSRSELGFPWLEYYEINVEGGKSGGGVNVYHWDDKRLLGLESGTLSRYEISGYVRAFLSNQNPLHD